jgi:hypothetical protein
MKPLSLTMHMPACIHERMRTTIEITNAQRARLLDLAARRGEKGFSALVREAVDRLLADEVSRKDRIEAALAVEGSLGASAADNLEASVSRIRDNWR